MFLFSNKDDIKFEPKSLEHAYISIICEDLDSALNVFLTHDSPRGLWGITLVEILQGCIYKIPTYFQIRNFYEIDLDFLMMNKKIHYIEQLLGSTEFLSSYNIEVFKYTARVLYRHKYYKAADEYFEKAKKIFYRDPELHFLLAKANIDFQRYDIANSYIDECIKILPDYYPAKLLKNDILEYLNI